MTSNALVSSKPPQRRPRVARSAVVLRTEELTPQMVRIVFGGEGVATLPELSYTDHYIKLLFPPAGAGYSWPFDPEVIKEREPADRWPVTRTYTIRSLDLVSNEMTVDFVVHGAEGLAGPWAARAEAGDEIGFFGPGGAFAPDLDADAYLLVGDEAALPAIAATLERLPARAHVRVFLEVDGPQDQQPLTLGGDTMVHWVHRTGAGLGYGRAVALAVRDHSLPPGRLQAFVHGNADMVRDLRRFLFVEHGVDRRSVSISGYWRTGHTEDRWQATKGEFNQQMEAEETASV